MKNKKKIKGKDYTAVYTKKADKNGIQRGTVSFDVKVENEKPIVYGGLVLKSASNSEDRQVLICTIGTMRAYITYNKKQGTYSAYVDNNPLVVVKGIIFEEVIKDILHVIKQGLLLNLEAINSIRIEK